ncbi:MAG TPA: hypothetical protein VKE41_14930 [Roseiflexaceae bacterium]|nr:hypothetical protein [Roseiflexaceae bacterium]
MSNTPQEEADRASLVQSWKPYFIAEYERDQRNARRQTFDEYWRWVTTFLLLGGSGYAGWLAQTATAAAAIREQATRQRLDTRALELGKRIAAEWSKDSATRKIYSNPFQGRPNLLDWGRKIQRAARDEPGDGHALEAALDGIESDLDAALRE